MSVPMLKNEKIKGLWNCELKSGEFIDQIKNVYHSLLMSIYGPNSGLTAIQNSAGRYVYSASSTVVLEQLQFFHPVFKFMNALVNVQNKLFGTHGLFVGLLCSGLLYRFLQLERGNLSYRLFKDVSDWIIPKLIHEIQFTSTQILLKVDLANIDHILCIIKGIFNSKVYSLLLKEETDHLYLIIMQCYIKSLPHENQSEFSHIHISTIEGSSSLNTQIFEGVLYREADYTYDDLVKILKKIPKHNLKVVVFNIPLSSNSEEKGVVKWAGKSSAETTFNHYLICQLKRNLIENGIHVIANQKYIDDAIKYELEKAGFLVLERLGTRLASSLTLMCRCHPITSLSEIELTKNIGFIRSIEPVNIEGKSFLHLTSDITSQSLTLVLTGLNGHIVEYLKEVVECCLNVLQHSIVNDPSIVCGGGCFEAFLAFKLICMEKDHIRELSEQFDSCSTKISQVFRVFTDTFLQLCVKPSGSNSKHLIDYCIDSSYNHLWLLDESNICSEGSESQVQMDQKPNAEESTVKIKYEASYLNCKKVTVNPLALTGSVTTRSSSLVDMSSLCVCKSIKQSELPEGTYFISLSSLKNHNFNKFPVSDNAASDIVFQKDSLCDYWPAKLSALRLALDGLSDLLQVGNCIFDK